MNTLLIITIVVLFSPILTSILMVVSAFTLGKRVAQAIHQATQPKLGGNQ